MRRLTLVGLAASLALALIAVPSLTAADPPASTPFGGGFDLTRWGRESQPSSEERRREERGEERRGERREEQARRDRRTAEGFLRFFDWLNHGSPRPIDAGATGGAPGTGVSLPPNQPGAGNPDMGGNNSSRDSDTRGAVTPTPTPRKP